MRTVRESGYQHVRLMLCAVGLSLALDASISRGQGRDAEFVSKLLERRLYSLAEAACVERLADMQLEQDTRRQLTITLVRTYAEHAVGTGPDERDPFWKQARDTAADYSRRFRNDPRRILVDVQDGLTLLARGELLRNESEVAATAAESRERAREAIREATRAFEAIDKELARMIPRAPKRSGASGELTSGELFSLRNHVKLHAARAYRNQALCYPADSNDSLAALGIAIEQLAQPLTQLPQDDPLVAEILIDQAICYRLRRDATRAAQLLTAVAGRNPNAETQAKLAAESVRLLLAAGRSAEALTQLDQLPGPPTADVDFARLETFIALAEAAARAKDRTALGKWQRDAAAWVDRIEDNHGPYWGRRAELLLVNSAGRSPAVANTSILSRTADNLFLKGQFDEAVVAYGKAADQARTDQQPDIAFQLDYKAALVQQQRRRHVDAGHRLRRLAAANVPHAQAADAQLLAAWNYAQAARSDAEQTDDYEATLVELIQIWPGSSASSTGRQWFGQLLEARAQWAAAVDVYTAIPGDSPNFLEVVVAVTRCWNRRLRELGDEASGTAPAAADFFDFVVGGPERRLPERWSPAAREAALAGASIRLNYLPHDLDAVERTLTAALDAAADTDPTWSARCQALLVATLARQGRHADADKRLSQIQQSGAAHLLDLCLLFDQMIQATPADSQEPLAQLALRVVDRLTPLRGQLDESQMGELDRLNAVALAAAGRRPEAIKRYAQLVAQTPNDAATHVAYAQLLLDGTTPEDWNVALDQWRRIAGRSPAETEIWYRAKYSVALAQLRLQQQAAAAQLIRYLQATSAVDQSPWAERFRDLLAECMK